MALLAAPSLTRCDKLYRQPPGVSSIFHVRSGVRFHVDTKLRTRLHSSGGGSLYTNAAAAADIDGKLAEPVLLISMFSLYNYISILEIPLESPSEFAGARLLLLDDTGNVHSIFKSDSKFTGAYWDEVSSLPAIIPGGTIAIFGLGGGTAARLLLDLWPERCLEGWEIDQILIDKARMYLGLAEIEGPNEHGGGLIVHIGDAFCEENDPEEGFAGIVVDLFSNGEVLPVLREAETWFKLKRRLKAGGRIMINCVEEIASDDEGKPWPVDEHLVLHAMLRAFPEGVQWRRLDKVNNKMAFTGPLPNVEEWCNAVHEKLRPGVHEWKCFY